MLRSLVLRGWQSERLQRWQRLCSSRELSTSVQQQDEPLRILFCGSEAFSITALEALKEYQDSGKSNILSIDVATKEDKPSGRGMKSMRSPQIKRAAARLGLRVHQFDTFTGWHLPEYGEAPQPYINLIVAVSFGLLVPPRILKNARFGGLNVHPSMLPDLRGAAPINWSIIRGHTQTGVTVQTLHPSKFDYGVILDQTPAPGIAIPDPQRTTAHELRLLLAPVGAEMLVKAIHNKLYLQPHREFKSQYSNSPSSQINLAPKIVSSMKAINPYEDDLSKILRKNRAIPKLWAEADVSTDQGKQTRRVIFGTSLRPASEEDLPAEDMKKVVTEIPIGVPFALILSTDDINQSRNPIFLKVKDRGILVVPDLLVAGDREGPAAAAAAHAKLFTEPLLKGSYKLYTFQQSLKTSAAEF